jgi:hypothetical protein
MKCFSQETLQKGSKVKPVASSNCSGDGCIILLHILVEAAHTPSENHTCKKQKISNQILDKKCYFNVQDMQNRNTNSLGSNCFLKGCCMLENVEL